MLNDTPPGADARVVKQATFKIGTPQKVLYTVVGFGTQFPALPEQYYAELSLDEGVAQGDEIFVDLEIVKHDGSGSLDISNWKLEVDPAVLISGVDIKILHRPASPNDYRARATTAGDNYAFKEENEEF